MKLTIRYFGMLADFTGCTQETLEVDQATNSKELMQIINGQYEQLSGLEVKMALNQTIVNDEISVFSERDEIAFLPPYAGG